MDAGLRPPDEDHRPAQPPSGRRVALRQFALSSLAVAFVIGTIGAVALHHVAKNEAIDDARTLTAVLARGVLAPQLDHAVMRRDHEAVARLDAILKARGVDDPIVRVKIWSRDGRIVYSDQHAAIGRRFELADDLRDAFASGTVRAEVSDLKRPENRLDHFAAPRMLEVYLPVQATDGTPLVVETYRSTDSIDAAGGRIWHAVLPVLVLVLLALGAAQLPLASFLERRVRHHEHERARLELQAEERIEQERLRIAAELHDGVIQDLAGTAYHFQAAADTLPTDPFAPPGSGLSETLRDGARVCRDAVRALRVLLVDLAPPDGARPERLDLALDRLAGQLRGRGVRVHISVDLAADLPAHAAELVLRGAQEALRNVDRHADARTVSVQLRSDARLVTLRVEDDGRGMTGSELDAQHAEGHMGLRLLANGIAQRGGSMRIESSPGTGTGLVLDLPLDSAPPARPPASQTASPA